MRRVADPRVDSLTKQTGQYSPHPLTSRRLGRLILARSRQLRLLMSGARIGSRVGRVSPFHLTRVFKQTTGMSALQFVTRERITRAQQLTRETKRSLIEIGLEVSYKNPSHFAQVFRRVAGREFRSAL